MELRVHRPILIPALELRAVGIMTAPMMTLQELSETGCAEDASRV